MHVVYTCDHTNRRRGSELRVDGSASFAGNPAWYLLIIAISIILIMVPASAGGSPDISLQVPVTKPQIVNVSIYVVDFNRFDVTAGTVGADFYLTLTSDSPVSIDDIELMNGMITSVTPIKDTPLEKEYRIIAVLTAEPDLSRYPFDRDTLFIRLEPRVRTEQEMVLAADPVLSGISNEADLPGWKFTGKTGSYTANNSYLIDEVPFSRVIFDFGIVRDVTSMVLKFFLPLILIILVSLSSLMMKNTSRLGLNASMFLAAILIHWRISDTIPAVAYATFLDLFMIITYATLVMVLLSGILILKFMESGNIMRADQINFWSIRLIPPLTIGLFLLLFSTLAV
jgi:hypothetical protein